MIPRLLTKWKSKRSNIIVAAFKLVWFLAIFIGEFFAFWRASSRCSPWPVNSSWNTQTPRSHTLDNEIQRVSSLLEISLTECDPQLTDKFSYGRTGIIQWLTEFYSDLYMQRNWNKLNRKLKPDAVVFLGDLMDGGREWIDDIEWNKEVQRFKNVFKPRSGNVKHYYMAGNHDLGFGDGIKLNVVDRFEKEFGDTSYELSFESHSMVVIDSVAMSSTNAQINQKSRDFVRQLRPSDKPRILFSHVPLYRQPSPISGTLTAPAAEDMCGPLRQKSKQIRQGVGYQYQNLMTKELTDFILTQAEPDIIFSGDDHDYCEVFHTFGTRKIPEISVNTFSMAQGIQYPGVVLLNLYAGGASKSESYTTKLCLLPDQISIFIRYAILLCITILCLLGNNILDQYGYSLLSASSPIMPSTRQEADKADAREHQHLSQRRFLIFKILEAVKRTAKDIRQIAIPSLLFYLICVLLL